MLATSVFTTNDTCLYLSYFEGPSLLIILVSYLTSS